MCWGFGSSPSFILLHLKPLAAKLYLYGKLVSGAPGILHRTDSPHLPRIKYCSIFVSRLKYCQIKILPRSKYCSIFVSSELLRKSEMIIIWCISKTRHGFNVAALWIAFSYGSWIKATSWHRAIENWSILQAVRIFRTRWNSKSGMIWDLFIYI